jgi:hypothetical protein
MLIECAYCNSRVDARVLAEHEEPPSEFGESVKYIFLVCPICRNAHVGVSEEIQTGPEEFTWTELTRVWPNPPRHFDHNVPGLVRSSIDEAEKCYRAEAYSACAVMCGRAIEGICVQLAGEITIAKGLQKLKSNNIIDGRLFEWAESLRKERNIGAHASEETTSKDNARDILDFARAIIDYIFVLSARYEDYKQRKSKKKV